MDALLHFVVVGSLGQEPLRLNIKHKLIFRRLSMRNFCLYSTFVVIIILFSGCYAHVHKIGKGPQTGVEVSKRQWYLISGLLPVNDEKNFGPSKHVDGGKMAEDTKNYEIKTEYTLIDFIISGALNSVVPVTVGARSVTVTK